MLPNADRATIEPSKVRDYLLSPAHPIGRFKAAVFAALGYTQDDWQHDIRHVGDQDVIAVRTLARAGG